MRTVLLLLALAASASAQPNVVLVYVDDLDLQSMEALDGLAAVTRDAGLEFTRGYVPNSLCGPSRGSLLTGVSSHTNDFLFNGKGYYLDWRDAGWEDRSFPMLLRDAGYYTAHVGKPVNGWPGRDDFYAPPGWDHYTAVVGDSTLYTDFETWESIEGAEALTSYVGSGVYRTDLEAEIATDAMRRAVDLGRPFFLYLSVYGPHAESVIEPPEAVPAPRHVGAFAGASVPRDPDFDEADVSDKHALIRERSQVGDVDVVDTFYRTRLASMLAVEDAVRAVRAELDALGVADDTYLFFVSDNGIMLGHHRVRFSKGFPYERSAHVPFYVSGPGLAPGATSDALVSILDLAPTVLDLAGAPAPEYLEGRSLAPLLRGEAVPWRETLLLEGWRPEGEPYYRAIVTAGGLKAATFPVSLESELYDLAVDPFEIDSGDRLIDPATRDALRARIDSLAACAGAACFAIERRPEPPVDAVVGRVSGDAVAGGTLNVAWESIGVDGDLTVALLTAAGREVVGAADVRAGRASVLVPLNLEGDSVRVELRSADGAAVWVDDPVKIADAPVGEGALRVFPTPTPGPLRVELDVVRGQNVRIELFDVLGRRLSRLYAESVDDNARLRLDFDLGGLPAGPYLLRTYGRLFSFDRVVVVQ